MSLSPTSLQATLTRLRQLSQMDVQSDWHRAPESWNGPSPWGEQAANWPRSPLNQRRHITWEGGGKSLWLYQCFTWPERLQGYPLEGLSARLSLRWWADQADLYRNGVQVHRGDLFDCWTRLLICDQVRPGETVEMALHLISPGHDQGALVKSQICFEATRADELEPGFVADELAVLATYLQAFQPDQMPRLEQALTTIAWPHLGDRPSFDQSLGQVRRSLQDFSPWLKQRTIHCLGHAHLDLAWLWPVAETWAAAIRTFESVLALQQDFPELTFSHSSPALLAWLEEHQPELFEAVQQQVQAGRWAIDAGLWVEPDLNLPGGEALARQVLYGQRYCLEKFGAVSAIAWLPDSFGFSWQLPQILRQGGIRFFATQKLRWNDTNPFPHHLFTWQGRDGTSLTSLTLPPIGTDIEPLEMAHHACEWEANTGQPDCLWLPGVGDHGGGPSRDMLVQARRWAASPFFPRLIFGQAQPLFDQLVEVQPLANRPVWSDELYLELHRGCYTTHGDQKQFNRQCEDRLFEAELFASLATLMTAADYPRRALETAWKQVLFNQFHDILPGTSIGAVFEQANGDWQAALNSADQVLQNALARLASHCPLPPPPLPGAIALMVFNSLNWSRQEVVALPCPTVGPWRVVDEAGRSLPSQAAVDRQGTTLLVAAPPIPPLGYRVLWLVADEPGGDPPLPPGDWVLDNGYLRVRLDQTTGDIASLVDLRSHTEVLSGPGNQLQAFADRGQYWDAWNLDPNYSHHPLPEFQLEQLTWLEYGPCRQTIRVVRRFCQSTFVQDYSLDAQAVLVVIRSQVDWQENQVLVKAAFPCTVNVAQATYEIPFGAIDRPTVPQTPRDQARWEVPALRWADLSQGDRGLSIITDYKHGFDARPDQLRLTLLKSPLWPDPQADRGAHQFTYALYPHPQSWQEANTVQLARNLSLPLRAWPVDCEHQSPNPRASNPSASFLDLGDNGFVVTALKPSEDHPQRLILRGYESRGESCSLLLQSASPLTYQGEVNLLEELLSSSPVPVLPGGQPLEVRVKPWQIVSLALAPVT
ncbi:MAG: alpha-mannosidase [Nodosilinea sp.]